MILILLAVPAVLWVAMIAVVRAEQAVQLEPYRW